MTLTQETLQQLAEPFPVEAIKFKIQTKPNDKGNALVVAYIDARDVMDRLDKVAGGDWGDTYRPGHPSGLECSLTVCGTTRCDVGADNNDNETEKSAYSDAFKRAAVKFGIGRFLYDLPKMFAATRPMGRSFILADGEEVRLRKIIEGALNGKPGKQTQERKPQTTKAPAPTTTTAVPDRPYTAEVLKAGIEKKVQYHLDKGTTASVTDRKVLASILDTVLVDVTKRYELCTWLVGLASTQKMKQADVNALLDWLGVRAFNATPAEYVVKEIHAAHTAALLASGQQELIPQGA